MLSRHFALQQRNEAEANRVHRDQEGFTSPFQVKILQIVGR